MLSSIGEKKQKLAELQHQVNSEPFYLFDDVL
jgi:hypothetical protein